MGFSGALLALSAVQGISAIGQGYAQSNEDKYNASISNMQSQDLQIQGNITQGQYTREGGLAVANSMATVGASGIEPTGSAAAVMLNTLTQIHTDQAIAQFNNSQSVAYANARTNQYQRKASQDVFSGYSSGFSDLLRGASNYGQYKGSFNTNSGAGK